MTNKSEPEFVQTARKLVVLFNDPQPGSFAWAGAVFDLVVLLHEQTREWRME